MVQNSFFFHFMYQILKHVYNNMERNITLIFWEFIKKSYLSKIAILSCLSYVIFVKRYSDFFFETITYVKCFFLCNKSNNIFLACNLSFDIQILDQSFKMPKLSNLDIKIAKLIYIIFNIAVNIVYVSF